MTDIDTTRIAWVTTTLPDGRFVLEEMIGHEALGQVFAYELSLLSTDANIDLTTILGQPMTVHVSLPNRERTFNGIVTRAQNLGNLEEYARYQVTLRPWLWLLSYTENCRIFENKTVPAIVQEVFRHAGFSDFTTTLGHYQPLEYCVQYRESDLNFVSRLMESVGIYYYFKHAGEKHTMVITDSYGGHSKSPGYEKVPYRPPRDFVGAEAEHLNQWVLTQQIRSGSLEATDYDFKAPKASLLSRSNLPKKNAHASGALFEYPGYFLTKAAGDDRVKVRLEERQVDYALVDASGDVRGLGAGNLFNLIDHPRDDQNKEYLVVSAQYHIHAGQFTSGSGGEGAHARVSFGFLDSTVPFRPALSAHKARVEGPQTATVVGPAGAEIWTDEFARVKVQFHWDRYGKNDENSSCWVRVSQAWAGAHWGSIHIPRINQEVIVEFLEGDPDRPIITGRVYNKLQMPPYDLTDNKTQSGIKSRSTPGGGPNNFNEIRFEDAKGKELFFMQAEKDHTTTVKNNQSTSVGADRSLDVTGNDSTKVKGNRSRNVTGNDSTDIVGNQTLSVGVNRTKTVTGNESVTISGASTETITLARAVTIGAAYQITVGGVLNETVAGARTEEVGAAKAEAVGGASAEVVGGSKTIKVGGSISGTAAKAVTFSAGTDFGAKGAKHMTLEAGDSLTIKCGDASIVLKKGGDISINGKKIQVTASGDLILKGSKIPQN
jgi:type VI secretion system secreted protein VgrG